MHTLLLRFLHKDYMYIIELCIRPANHPGFETVEQARKPDDIQTFTNKPMLSS